MIDNVIGDVVDLHNNTSARTEFTHFKKSTFFFRGGLQHPLLTYGFTEIHILVCARVCVDRFSMFAVVIIHAVHKRRVSVEEFH